MILSIQQTLLVGYSDSYSRVQHLAQHIIGHFWDYLLVEANLTFHPSRVGKWVPASARKVKAGMVHSVSGCAWGVQVKLWDPLRMCAIPERLRGVFMTRRYTNPHLPLPLPWVMCAEKSCSMFLQDDLGPSHMRCFEVWLKCQFVRGLQSLGTLWCLSLQCMQHSEACHSNLAVCPRLW